jgi:Uma2 family endonuclease
MMTPKTNSKPHSSRAELATKLGVSSHEYDRSKLRAYASAGVKEYWLNDPEARTVEVLCLERGEYQLVGRWRPKGQAASRLLKGFKVPVRQLVGSAASVKGED